MAREEDRMRDDTPEADLAGAVAASLAAALPDAEVLAVNRGVQFRLHPDDEHVVVLPDGRWLRTGPYNPENCHDHELAVALVRACMAGGWARDVALLGCCPDTDYMLAWCAARGWIASVKVRALDISPQATIDVGKPMLYGGVGYETHTTAEATGRALLAAVAAVGREAGP